MTLNKFIAKGPAVQFWELISQLSRWIVVSPLPGFSGPPLAMIFSSSFAWKLIPVSAVAVAIEFVCLEAMPGPGAVGWFGQCFLPQTA